MYWHAAATAAAADTLYYRYTELRKLKKYMCITVYAYMCIYIERRLTGLHILAQVVIARAIIDHPSPHQHHHHNRHHHHYPHNGMTVIEESRTFIFITNNRMHVNNHNSD